MTLRLGEDHTVVAVPIPEIRGVPEGVDLISVDRKSGLLLRSVRFPVSEHLRDRMRKRMTDEHHAA
jgi:hypothetical protein